MTEFAICPCVEITHLKEKSEVITWKNNAISTFLFCINIDSSHQDWIGTVYEYQKYKASPVRYPVACFRLVCRHKELRLKTATSCRFTCRHKRVKHNNSNEFQVDLRKHRVMQNNSNEFQVDLRKHRVTQNNSNEFYFICGHRMLHFREETFFRFICRYKGLHVTTATCSRLT